MPEREFMSTQTVLNTVLDSEQSALRVLSSGITSISGSVVSIGTEAVNIFHVNMSTDVVAYSGGDLIGGKAVLSYVSTTGKGIITSAVIYDQSAQNPALDLIIFDSNPVNTTFMDNVQLDIADSDLNRICGILPISAWFTFASNSVGVVTAAQIPFDTEGDNNLYVAVVSRGTPTFATSSGLSYRLIMKTMPVE